jgi:hypothetical protein
MTLGAAGMAATSPRTTSRPALVEHQTAGL